MNLPWRSSISLVEETAAIIRERVFSGRYRPGDRLAQAELSAEIGLSRTPLREALRVLAQEGIVDADASGNARVATAGAAQLREAYEFREALGAAAVRLACPRIGERTLAELDRLVAAQRQAAGQQFHRLGADFHMLLLEASGNCYVQRHLSLVRMTEEVFRPPYGLQASDVHTVTAAHAAVVGSLRAEQPDQAGLHLRTFIRHELDIFARHHAAAQQERQPQ